MKKTLLAWALLTGVAPAARAQVNSGGLPLSRTSAEAALSDQYFSPVYYEAPDMQQILLEDAKASRMDPAPYRAGVLIHTDFSFPASGTLITLPDGRRVWRAQMVVGTAPALVFYYDRFRLPEGVRFFISNGNGKQVLGAFTSEANTPDGLFASQEVQGNTANLELDIDKDVDLNSIQLRINKAAVMYRSIGHLNVYAGTGDIMQKPTIDPIQGNASVCEVNAVCPEGQNYPQQRKATVRILIPVGNGYVGFCTGTLINNTRGDCTPYILTATHCEETNSKQDTTFSQWLFYFNFESPDCAGTINAPNNQVMRGAAFVSRANYNANSYAIIGDFLLLRLANKINASYGVYFAGWDRSSSMPSSGTYINFHHPAGDMKKLSLAGSLSPNGTFNQYSVPGTHWEVHFNTGGSEGGSSGSALFNTAGRIIGDLSGGTEYQYCTADTNGFGEQAIMGREALFSKFSRNWEYPEGNNALNAQLKPWLDPLNTGATTTSTIAAATACDMPATGIGNRNAELDNAVSVFPNPVTTGTVRVKVNFDKSADLSIAIYDITGARKATYNIGSARSGEYALDMSSFARGSYLITVSNGEATTSRKVMLIR